MRNGTNWCKSSCHEVAPEFFATKAPDPPIGPYTDVFFAFRTIWVHLGQFGRITKLGAKRAELVQKFVPRSRVRLFYNECTQSTPFDSKLVFWCVSYHLGAFGTVSLPYETWCKTGQTCAKVRATKSCRNFFANKAPDPPHWTLH